MSLQPSASIIGMAFICDSEGRIVKVLHNDLGTPESDILGRPFSMVVASSSFQKALTFLYELKSKRSVFDWEFDLSVKGNMTIVHCAGVAIDDGMLIITAYTHTAVLQLLDEMMRINNSQTNHVRWMSKEQANVNRDHERNISVVNELSRMNNELVNLQRELAKKNAELERLNAEVQRLTIMDELTQVYNRRGFFELGGQELERARRFGKGLAAIMMDIDHFKRVNDQRGHSIGDLVLKEVASRCSGQLRSLDILGRIGGEEFAILLPEIDMADAYNTAERLRIKTSVTAIDTEKGPLTVTVSLGVALLKPDMDLDELLEHADQALYCAKESGRNRACSFGENEA